MPKNHRQDSGRGQVGNYNCPRSENRVRIFQHTEGNPYFQVQEEADCAGSSDSHVYEQDSGRLFLVIYWRGTWRKDHATVLHACNTVTDLMQTDKMFKQYVADIEKC